jgi:hypothetical protein
LKEFDTFIQTLIKKQVHSTPSKLYQDVEGAPFNIGDMIIVLENPSNDETFNKWYVLKNGIIIYFECGCGQSYPSDPMIGVKFSDGKIEEFWKEEIKPSNQTF